MTYPPRRLRTEHAIEPLAVDETRPLLSWRLPASDGGTGDLDHQHYRVRVVASPLGKPAVDPRDESVPSCWDTGTVGGRATVSATYMGDPLQPQHRYRWAVTGGTDRQKPMWSEPASFETGLMGGTWIRTAPGWIGDDVRSEAFVDFDQASPENGIARIWLPADTGSAQPGAATARFRRTFSLPGGRPVQWARLHIGSAVSVTASLNGRPVAPGEIKSSLLTPGDNVLAVAATSTSASHPGLLVRLDIGAWATGPTTVVSDGQWRVFEGESAGEPEGWREPSFDDRRWSLAESYGQHGVAPFGRDVQSHHPSQYLRRRFTLDGQVAAARLRCTAIGIYEATLNGEPVSGDLLAPGWVDFSRRTPYQVYDVTQLLRAGANTWGAVLADGWALGNVSWFGRNQYAQRRAYSGELEIHFTDGRVVRIGTDDSWQVADGPILYADLQNGCVLDARLDRPGWDEPADRSDPTAWQPAPSVAVTTGPLQAQLAPPIRVMQELAPVSITRRDNGNLIVDFGQNLVGWVRLRVQATAGQHILLSHAEVLDADGELYVQALRTARATDSYLARGDEGGEIVEPRFTVHGFRFCEITGHPAELATEDIRALVAHADMEQIGDFACSDERLNRLQQNIIWSQRGNFLTVPTDCPQRDERLGWTGDAQVFAATAAFNYDVRTFLRKYLLDVRDATGADGGIPHVAPDVLSAQAGSPQVGAAGWGDVIAILPHALLWAFDDRRAVAENLEAIAGWLTYCRAHSVALIRPAEGFGDWLALEDTPVDLVSTAFFARAAQLATQLGEQLDDPRTDDWRRLAGEVRSAFRQRFIRGGGELTSTSQTGYLLALAFDLFEPAEKPGATRRLVTAIAAKNWHLSTGFLGTPFLLSVLRDQGELDLAYRLLLTETFPSWLYPIVAGDATTIWERWDSWSDSRGFQDPGMTSFNHYAYGAVGEWMYGTIGGLRALEPGYRRSRIAVQPGGGLTWARTSLDTPHGLLASDWRLVDDRLELEVTVPPGTVAEVVAPSGPIKEVGSGRHRFSWPSGQE